MMTFQITAIEFDFEDIDGMLQEEIYDDYIGSFWEADDEDDLVDEITTASGWCIKSIDYCHVLTH